MRHRRTLYSRLTARHLLIVRSEENLADKRTLSFTYAHLMGYLFILFIMLFAISFYLSNTVLSFWFNPKYEEQRLNQKLLNLSLAVDSLESEVYQKDLFIANFRNIITESVNQYDTVKSDKNEAPIVDEGDLDYLPPIDSQIRREFEGGAYTYNDYSNRRGGGDFGTIFFFSPINGILTDHYDAEKSHYGVDIVAATNEPVKAVADGTVILSSWTDDTGYVMTVQHRNDLISMYKHNSVLLKKVGDFVQAGEIIAIIGNSGELTTGPHLHFELWHKGNPVDPEEYISF